MPCTAFVDSRIDGELGCASCSLVSSSPSSVAALGPPRRLPTIGPGFSARGSTGPTASASFSGAPYASLYRRANSSVGCRIVGGDVYALESVCRAPAWSWISDAFASVDGLHTTAFAGPSVRRSGTPHRPAHACSSRDLSLPTAFARPRWSRGRRNLGVLPFFANRRIPVRPFGPRSKNHLFSPRQRSHRMISTRFPARPESTSIPLGTFPRPWTNGILHGI